MNVRFVRATRLRNLAISVTVSLAIVGRIGSTSAQESSGIQPAAGEAEWIWSPAHAKDVVPLATCYFRKAIKVAKGDSVTAQVTGDDDYELFVNGEPVGKGDDWRLMKIFNLAEQLHSGTNTIAVKVRNTKPPSAGLAIRLKVVSETDDEKSFSTDTSWKTSIKPADGWEAPDFDDAAWLPARSFGPFGSTEPWANQVAVDEGMLGRFLLAADFRVEQVIAAEDTGPLTAMAFNEWGEILAAREAGPILLIVDKDRDGLVETVGVYSDKVTNCQGLMALNGDVYAVGDGPDGAALYHLTDGDQDGTADQATAIVKFEPGMAEHGPHAPLLGPDGLIYVVVGNHAAVKVPYAPESPYHHPYEGDLAQPRYEDPNGHAVGIKAPGAVVIRTNTDGSFVECVAGGMRNPYDIAFNREGELFAYDADMEWDMGLPWYRPTRVNHVAAGAEFGWRSGWAKWPSYWLDGLPPVIETGRGSPTGLEVYNHYNFPLRFHNALFACDWSQGRIVVFRMKPSGGGYTATREIFLEGRPLNATDLAVGPDGGLYFATGGRGTEGGVYRVVWTGKVPPQPKLKGVMSAIRQPQLSSAWARQEVAVTQKKMGADWQKQLNAVVDNTANAVNDRVRALDLMQLVGPFPNAKSLLKWSKDGRPEVRTKAAWLMGLHSETKAGDDTAGVRLVQMLADTEPVVRRAACEALTRGGYQPPAEPLVSLLADPHRQVVWAARLALECLPVARWETAVLEARDPRTFLQGSLALLAMDPKDETIDAILTSASERMKAYLKDEDFVDLLRVVQRALERGKLTRKNVPALCKQLADEYPANEPKGRVQRINRELTRLLAYLQETSVIERFITVIEGDAPAEEKLHTAFYARFITSGWTPQQKLALVEFYEKAHELPGGHSYVGYIDNVSRDFVAGMNDEERQLVLADATRWPTGALWVLATLPVDPGEAILARLIALDDQLAAIDGPAIKRLATGVVAVLGRSGAPEAMAHLRKNYEAHPRRREELAMGLAQTPGGENWPVLVKSLSIVEGVAAQEVLGQLATVESIPDGPEPIRQVILCGLKLKENGGTLAVKLLGRWTGERAHQPGDTWDTALAAWQRWFENKYPNEPAPTLPEEPQEARFSYPELLGYLTGDTATRGNPERGAEMFTTAKCVKCHRYGTRGEGVGPDLSTVGLRFQRKEILESIIFPSQVISDQYASKTVTTSAGRTYTGIIAPAGNGSIVVLQANGEKATIHKDDIEETSPSKKSAMPEGLLNQLTLEQIADLFAYLSRPPRATSLTHLPENKLRK
ncbi:MAG TPA: HEAT repeat domain-containing protein [Pirellulales bacterium]|nr:HEAT repeat domain-containing protein [Pirellulales bacterium]